MKYTLQKQISRARYEPLIIENTSTYPAHISPRLNSAVTDDCFPYVHDSSIFSQKFSVIIFFYSVSAHRKQWTQTFESGEIFLLNSRILG